MFNYPFFLFFFICVIVIYVSTNNPIIEPNNKQLLNIVFSSNNIKYIIKPKNKNIPNISPFVSIIYFGIILNIIVYI